MSNQIAQSLDANAMINVLWQNQYGDKVVGEVPVHAMNKYEVERLKKQSLSSLKAAHLLSKVDSLEKEVSSLKSENTELKQSMEILNTKLDTQAATTNDVLLNQQQMLYFMI